MAIYVSRAGRQLPLKNGFVGEGHVIIIKKKKRKENVKRQFIGEPDAMKRKGSTKLPLPRVQNSTQRQKDE